MLLNNWQNSSSFGNPVHTHVPALYGQSFSPSHAHASHFSHNASSTSPHRSMSPQHHHSSWITAPAVSSDAFLHTHQLLQLDPAYQQSLSLTGNRMTISGEEILHMPDHYSPAIDRAAYLHSHHQTTPSLEAGSAAYFNPSRSGTLRASRATGSHLEQDMTPDPGDHYLSGNIGLTTSGTEEAAQPPTRVGPSRFAKQEDVRPTSAQYLQSDAKSHPPRRGSEGTDVYYHSRSSEADSNRRSAPSMAPSVQQPELPSRLAWDFPPGDDVDGDTDVGDTDRDRDAELNSDANGNQGSSFGDVDDFVQIIDTRETKSQTSKSQMAAFPVAMPPRQQEHVKGLHTHGAPQTPQQVAALPVAMPPRQQEHVKGLHTHGAPQTPQQVAALPVAMPPRQQEHVKGLHTHGTPQTLQFNPQYFSQTSQFSVGGSQRSAPQPAPQLSNVGGSLRDDASQRSAPQPAPQLSNVGGSLRDDASQRSAPQPAPQLSNVGGSLRDDASKAALSHPALSWRLQNVENCSFDAASADENDVHPSFGADLYPHSSGDRGFLSAADEALAVMRLSATRLADMLSAQKPIIPTLTPMDFDSYQPDSTSEPIRVSYDDSVQYRGNVSNTGKTADTNLSSWSANEQERTAPTTATSKGGMSRVSGPGYRRVPPLETHEGVSSQAISPAVIAFNGLQLEKPNRASPPPQSRAPCGALANSPPPRSFSPRRPSPPPESNFLPPQLKGFLELKNAGAFGPLVDPTVNQEPGVGDSVLQWRRHRGDEQVSVKTGPVEVLCCNLANTPDRRNSHGGHGLHTAPTGPARVQPPPRHASPQRVNPIKEAQTLDSCPHPSTGPRSYPRQVLDSAYQVNAPAATGTSAGVALPSYTSNDSNPYPPNTRNGAVALGLMQMSRAEQKARGTQSAPARELFEPGSNSTPPPLTTDSQPVGTRRPTVRSQSRTTSVPRRSSSRGVGGGPMSPAILALAGNEPPSMLANSRTNGLISQKDHFWREVSHQRAHSVSLTPTHFIPNIESKKSPGIQLCTESSALHTAPVVSPAMGGPSSRSVPSSQNRQRPSQFNEGPGMRTFNLSPFLSHHDPSSSFIITFQLVPKVAARGCPARVFEEFTGWRSAMS